MEAISTAWENDFATRILERGADYYERGLVRDLERTGDTVTAVVSGSEDYELEIVDGEVVAMFCACPHAEDGNSCKHMAAACFALSSGRVPDSSKPQPEAAPEPDYRKMMDALTETQLRELLRILASGDRGIQSLIITYATGQAPKGHTSALKQEVDNITKRASDADGYIDYRSAWDYTSALEEFLERETEKLLSLGLIMEAFELTCYAFLAASSAEMDDSDGGLASLGECCSSLWKQQLDAADKKQRASMFEWFETTLDEKHDAWFAELLSDVQTTLFHDPALMEKALARTDARLLAAEERMGKDERRGRYELASAVADRLAIMERLQRLPEELAAFRSRYRFLPEIRHAEAEEHIRSRRFEEAIALLRESKTLDARYPGLVAEYSKMLIELYEKTGQTKELAGRSSIR